MADDRPSISVVMPCLNEEATVGACVDDARAFLDRRSFTGEVIVVDNGSTDASAERAASHGATIVSEPRRGYGRAVRTGFSHAKGRVIVMGDCDMTYDFAHMDNLVNPLLAGEADMMIGDRFSGQMEPGAMPFIHQLGVPFLSWCGRTRCRVESRQDKMGGVDVRDFHCGLRSLTSEAYRKCTFCTEGMEFASEMIVEATRKGLRIGQTSIPLRRGPRDRKPKLRTFSDGWRHLRYLLMC